MFFSVQFPNRIYAGGGDDTLILGESDRAVGGEGSDRFFVTSGGNNTITGGAGADQFWLASGEFPETANIITDFTSGEDVLGIAGLGIGFVDVSIIQQGDDVLIGANERGLAILTDIDLSAVNDSNNFVFV